MPERLVLIFLIDALGFRQAGDSTFLPDLDQPRAPVRSILGYSSGAIPTLLSGQLPDRHGHFVMYRRAGADGVFRGLGPLLSLSSRLTQRRGLLSRAITRYLHWRGVTGYFSLYDIPLRLLTQFDLSQRLDIYTPGALGDLTGLPDELERTGSYRLWSWRVPEEQALAELGEEVRRGERRVLFLYTPALDALMHSVGPESPAVQARLQDYDRRIKALLQEASKRYRQVRIFIFGDHGMAPVHGSHDLWGALRALGLRVPQDFLFFLDATMARFWFKTETARRQVVGLLQTLPFGRILPGEELAALGAGFRNAEYGECIFLMEEGKMLVPSFMSGAPLLGMHGYHPDGRHSSTTLVTNVHDRPYPRDLIELHGLLREEIREAGR